MVDVNNANAYTEALEIIKYFEKEDYEKIPQKEIENLEKCSNKEYKFKYNPNLTLEEQNVSKVAKIVIGILFRDYVATEKQREKIIAVQNYERLKLEEEKRKKYNPDAILKNKDVTSESNEVALVEIKKIQWYDKLFLFFKKIFNKNIS